ncbi:MAG TPA: FAD-dependent oxidoreductase [Chitinophagales bacterium]|nr:FAD-dependent oxidoreductase [Chitinophagales bacterium]
MRLRTFESFWLLKNGILNSYSSLHDKNEICEIVVVGGGITGALVSHALMEKGYEVVLIDKRDIASGSTSATTSLLQYEVDIPLYKLSEMIGEKPAVHCYLAGIDAIHKLKSLTTELEPDCSFEMKNSLFIARDKADAGWLKKEFIIRKKYNLGVNWLEPDEVRKIYNINSYGAILSDVAASVDAYKLTHALIARNVSRGMRVYDQTEMKDFAVTKNGISLMVSGDCKIFCDKVIFCTGYESTELLKEKIADLFYTYASVSEKCIHLPETLKEIIVWDTGSPYLYMRCTDDGRLLIGGEDSAFDFPFFQQKIKEHKAVKLKNAIGKMLNDVTFIEDFSWAGKFGSTKDGLHYIGKSPEFDKTLFALGFGGNGITFSVQAMDIITDLLKGKQNTLSKWYGFGR